VVLTTKNEFVVAAVRKVIYVWDSQTGSLVKTLDGHFARVTALLSVTSRDVNNVISVSIDKTVKVPRVLITSARSYCIGIGDGGKGGASPSPKIGIM